MKTLKFEKVIYRNHEIVERKVLYSWSGVTPYSAKLICQNFFDGFRSALKSDYRMPAIPFTMGYVLSSWNLHKDGNGWQYRFVDGRNHIVKFIPKFH